MLKWILSLAFLVASYTGVYTQYALCEADWFAFRLKWADQFETIEPLPLSNRLAAVWRNGRCGIAGRDGRLILPLQYQERTSYKPVLRDDGRFAGVREDGSVWELSGYDDIQPFWGNLWQLSRDGLTGLMDSTLQRWILPPRFTEITGDGKHLYATDTSGRWGEIDLSGRWIDPPGVIKLSNGLFIRWSGKWRYTLTDSAGTPLSGDRYWNVVPMCDGSFWADLSSDNRPLYVGNARYYRHCDRNGNLLPDSACQRMISAGAGGSVLKVLRNKRYELWDSCGNVLLPGASWEYEEENVRAYEFPDYEPFLPYDLVRFQKDKLFGIYLPGNKKIIPPQYRRIYAAPGKIIGARASGGTDWYARAGNLLKTTPDSITGLPDPSSKRFFVTGKDGLQGVIDAEGKVIIPARYLYLRHAGSGCYTYRGSSGGDRLLNPFGKEIPLPAGCYFDRVCGNYILFRRGTTGGLADLSGRVVVEPKYNNLSPLRDNFLFQFKSENDLYGIVDATGRVVLPAAYRQNAIQLLHGYIFLEKDSFYGIADRKGRLIHRFEYTGKNWLGRNTVLTKGAETFVFQPASGALVPMGFEWGRTVSNGHVTARRKGRWGLLNSQLEQVLPFEYDTVFQQEYHVVARREGKERWYKAEKGKMKEVAVDRIIKYYYWTTLFERGGKLGLAYHSGDTLPAIYDQIALDHRRKKVMALLRDGICTVPAENGQAPRFVFPADSLRSFYIDDWLQYWHKGEAWLMNTANGAKRQMELLTNTGEEGRYEASCITGESAVALEPAIVYRVRTGGRERYALLDSLLQDRVPDSLDIDPKKLMHKPGGKLILRIARNGREGLWDVDERRWVFPCAYDALEKVEQHTDRHVRRGGLSMVVRYPAGVVLLRYNGLYGLGRIADGAVLLPCAYDKIESFITKDSFLQISKDGKHGLYKTPDEKMLPPLYAYPLYQQRDGLISLYVQGEGSGFADANLNIIVPPVHQETMRTGRYITVRKDSLWGFYDRQGNLVQPYQYHRVDKIEGCGKLIATRQRQCALLSEDLQPLTGFNFDFIDVSLLPNGRLEYGYYKWDSVLNCSVSWHGLLDTFGKVVLQARFRDLFFCNDLLVVADSALRKYGICRPDLSVLAPFAYDQIHCTSDSNFIVRENGKWGILDREGRHLAKSEYDNIEESDGRTAPYIVGKNERYALMDRSGRLITGFDYDYADGFRAGRAAVRKEDRWGYVDSSGRVVIPLQYAFADKFSRAGLAWVLSDGSLRQIDVDGKKAAGGIPDKIEHQRYYSSGWSATKAGMTDYYGRTVLENDSLVIMPPNGPVCIYQALKPDAGARSGLMDLSGRILTPRIFDSAYHNTLFDHSEIVPVERLGKWGYLHRRGEMIIPFQYDQAGQFGRDGLLARVERNGKSFVIDRTGKCVQNCD